MSKISNKFSYQLNTDLELKMYTAIKDAESRRAVSLAKACAAVAGKHKFSLEDLKDAYMAGVEDQTYTPPDLNLTFYKWFEKKMKR